MKRIIKTVVATIVSLVVIAGMIAVGASLSVVSSGASSVVILALTVIGITAFWWSQGGE